MALRFTAQSGGNFAGEEVLVMWASYWNGVDAPSVKCKTRRREMRNSSRKGTARLRHGGGTVA